jgi:hypothetical protein
MSKPRAVRRALVTMFVAAVLMTPMATAQWVEYVDDSTNRMVADSSVGLGDVREKDFAWGDIDGDGDTDLVVVRKQPFTTAGKNANVLFLNENGVLVDRTSTFATASSVNGDNGFLTPTNDRDVQLGDLNGDGMLDVVTATTISFGDPKHIGHPRIYINQGCSGPCDGTNWLGFRFENDRIPTMLTHNGNSGVNPCFCSVSIGDVTGDGWPDLYFGDYDSGGGGAVGTCGASSNDFNDKLLVNAGASNPGFFTDVTSNRFFGNVPGLGQGFEISAFGAANALIDVNGDNITDIVKQSSLNAPTYVGVAYNESGNEGFFDTYDVVNDLAPYFVSVGDLNNDNDIDMVITDDGADRYYMNGGGFPVPNFTGFVFSYFHNGAGGASSDDGFGGNSLVVDLDQDGWNDVLITDVDVDISGCSRRMHIYRNLGGTPGSNVTLQEITQGSGCQSFQGNPATCTVASIPSNLLEGVHDVAVFDLNGDGWNDMILGRCNSTEIYLQNPQGEPVGGVPNGDDISGQQLTVQRNDVAGDSLTLAWGDSCINTDSDYAIYEGGIGEWYSHTAKDCSTSGASTMTITPKSHPVGTYYLVVPNNAVVEGPYGNDSTGQARPTGNDNCYLQNVGSCDP